MKSLPMRELFFIVLLFMAVRGNSQSVVKEYFDREGKKSTEAESYYYKVGRKVLFLNSVYSTDTIESYVDTVFSYYTHNHAMKGREMYDKEGFRYGLQLAYYDNGKPETRGSFLKDRWVGYYMSWYPNSKPHEVFQYPESKGSISDNDEYDFKIINYWDSLGHQLVKDGEGTCACYFLKEDDVYVLEKGLVRAGLRDSVWQGYQNETLLFEESYAKSKLLGGVRFGTTQVEYKEFQTQPEYRGGFEAMAKFLYNTLTYPVEAKRMGIDGSVFVAFMVDEIGQLSEVEVIKGVHKALDAEAVRVVKRMPKWTPGNIRGKTAKMKFVLPIKFKLS